MTAPEEYEFISNCSNFNNMLAGAAAGIAEHYFVYPLDLIKTRVQAQITPEKTGKIIVPKVPRSLWKGSTSVVFGAGPAHALYFGTYEFSKKTLLKVESVPASLAYALSGSLATIIGDAFFNPFDVVKQRMQLQNSPYRNPFQCAMHILRNEGVGVFYASYPTTLSINIPFHFMQLAAYETLSDLLNPSREYNILTHLVAGGLAGCVAAFVTTPLDVIRTLIQTSNAATDKRLRGICNMRSASVVLYSMYGPMSFFRGAKPRMLSSIPSTAICWATYESFKIYLNLQAT